MNIQLVESLVNIIKVLSPEEQRLLEEKLKVHSLSEINSGRLDMIQYLLDNPIEVDDLEFMKREEIYDKI
jgi:hypothetical protein